jgi:hypothetical protein
MQNTAYDVHGGEKVAEGVYEDNYPVTIHPRITPPPLEI